MENKDIRELAAIMKEMGLTSLEYQNGSESLKLKRRTANFTTAADLGERITHHIDLSQDEPLAASGMFTVKSPMVGVFYAAPSPDTDPYVSVGDAVHAGDVLCIIEAMKIMNEITAERDGFIMEIFVENKDIVEYGQPIFRIGTQ